MSYRHGDSELGDLAVRTVEQRLSRAAVQANGLNQ